VPHIKGTNPNSPELPTESALKAVCGLQVVLKKNSLGGTIVKNFIVSYDKLASIANVIPIVIQLDSLKNPFNKSSFKPLVFCLGPIHINIHLPLLRRRVPKHSLQY
jgi:hypothetical protein